MASQGTWITLCFYFYAVVTKDCEGDLSGVGGLMQGKNCLVDSFVS